MLKGDGNYKGKMTTDRKLEIHGTILNARRMVLKRGYLSYRTETKHQRKKIYKTN